MPARSQAVPDDRVLHLDTTSKGRHLRYTRLELVGLHSAYIDQCDGRGPHSSVQRSSEATKRARFRRLIWAADEWRVMATRAGVTAVSILRWRYSARGTGTGRSCVPWQGGRGNAPMDDIGHGQLLGRTPTSRTHKSR